MEISKGAIGVLAAVCVTGGAATAYYTARHHSVAEPATAAAPVSPGPASPQVEQSEEVVSEPTAPAAATAAVATPAATECALRSYAKPPAEVAPVETTAQGG